MLYKIAVFNFFSKSRFVFSYNSIDQTLDICFEHFSGFNLRTYSYLKENYFLSKTAVFRHLVSPLSFAIRGTVFNSFVSTPRKTILELLTRNQPDLIFLTQWKDTDFWKAIMSNARFMVDYGKRVSNCKKCKQKLDKGVSSLVFKFFVF